MSQTPSSEDELAGTEQPFVQHLMELRDRLVKAIVAVGVSPNPIVPTSIQGLELGRAGADVVRASIRTGDFALRYGGEEVLITGQAESFEAGEAPVIE